MKEMIRLKQWLLSPSSTYKFEKAFLDNWVDPLGKVHVREKQYFIK